MSTDRDKYPVIIRDSAGVDEKVIDVEWKPVIIDAESESIKLKWTNVPASGEHGHDQNQHDNPAPLVPLSELRFDVAYDKQE